MKTSGQPSLLRICVLILMFLSYSDTYVFSKPRGGQVVSGTASFTQDGNLTVITAGNRSVINYQSFDIGKNETVQFIQPGAHATVLNRVLTPDPTNIFGHLEANGIVIISNPYGVFFQNGAVINVGGLIAGAGKITDADFTAGKIHFTDLTGDVRNDGVIAADNRIALMGANVVNTGTATAARGVAMMVSGPDVYVGDRNGNIFVQANGKAVKAAAAATGATASASAGGVTNSGTVSAPRVVLGAGDMYSTAIVNSGLLQGRSVAVNAGRNGSVTLGGTVDATSAGNPTATGTGGNVDVLGGTVVLRGATVDASGSAGGGSVRVGGDFHGAGTLAHAAATTVDAASTIRADATGATGNGGSVVLWSDAATAFAGNISARGGTSGGNGGSVEVSSRNALSYRGFADLTATAGKTGSLLLDPDNIVIDTGGLDTLPAPVVVVNPPSSTVTDDFSTGPGTQTIAPATLAAALVASNVILDANNIIIFRASVTSGTANSLTLNAGKSIYIGDPGTNPLNLMTAPGATNATLSLGGAFTAVFNASGASAATRTSGGGAFRMTAGSALTAPGGVSITGGTFDDGTGVPANTGGVTVGNITTQGGILTVDNHLSAAQGMLVNGPLDTSATAANSAGGNLTLSTANGLTLNSTINASGTGTGNGGIVGLTTAAGDFVANATTDTVASNSAGTGNGGNVTITATAGSINDLGAVNSESRSATGNGTANGGVVNLTAGNGTLTVGAINTYSTGTAAANTGLAGNITLQSTGLLTTGNIDASANSAFAASTNSGGGGTVSITSSGGGVSTGTISTVAGDQGTTATGGDVTISGLGGTVATGTINTFSVGGGRGGNVQLTSAGDLTPGAIGTTSTSNNGGNVKLVANNSAAASTVTVPTLQTNGGGAASGSIEVDNNNTNAASAVTLGGSLTTVGTGTNTAGGAITLYNKAGDLNLGTNTVTTTGKGTGAGGNVALTAGGVLTVNGAVDATSPGGTAGTVALNGGTSLILGASVNGRSLTTGAGTANFNAGSAVTTSGGGQTYNGPLLLNQTAAGKLTTLTDSAGGAVSFISTIDSLSTNTGQSLTVNTTGNELFQGAIGSTTTLNNLTTDASNVGGSAQFGFALPAGATNPAGVNLSGALTVNDGVSFAVTGVSAAAPTVSSVGAQSYTGAMSLGANTFLTSTNGTITAGTVNGSTNQYNLTVAATAASATANASSFGVITNGGALVFNDTTGVAAFSGNVTGTSLSSTGANGVTFSNAATVTTTGAQNLTGLLTLGGATTLNSTGSTVTVGSVDGTASHYNLTVDATAASATANASSFGVITNGGALVFNDTVGVAAFSGNVTGTSFSSLGANGMSFGGPATLTATTGDISIAGALTLGGATTLTSSLGAVGVGSVAGGGFDLTVNATAPAGQAASTIGTISNGGVLRFFDNTGVAVFTGNITGTGFDSEGAGGVTLQNGGTVQTTGSQLFTGLLTLGGNSILKSTAPSGISVGSLQGNAHDLTVTGSNSSFGTVTNGGNLVFNVGNSVGAGFTSTVDATSLTVNGGKAGLAGNVTTHSATTGQSYGGGVSVGGSLTLADTASGGITFSGPVNGQTSGGQALTVKTDGTTTFTGAVGPLNPLGSFAVSGYSAAGNGTTLFNVAGGGVTVATQATNTTTLPGTQTYGNAVSVEQNTTLQSTFTGGATAGGNVTFNAPVNSFGTTAATQRSLTINTSGNEVFNQNALVGGTNALSALVTDDPLGAAGTSGGTAQFSMTLTGQGNNVAGVRVGAGGITINDLATFNVAGSSSARVPAAISGASGQNNPTVASGSAAQTYKGGVTDQQDTVLQGSTLAVTGTFNAGNKALTLDFSGQSVSVPLAGASFSNLASLASVGDGGTTITGNITTSGYQYYGNTTAGQPTLGNVTLASDAVLQSTGGGAIGFGGSLNGNHLLEVDTAGNEYFNGLVGFSTPLTSLQTDKAGTYVGGTAVFGMDLTGQALGTAGVRVATFVQTGDGAAFNVTGSAPGTTVANSLTSILTGTFQLYGGTATTLGQDTVLTTTGASTIELGSAVNGAHNLTANSPSVVEFDNPEGNSTPLLSLTTNFITADSGGSVYFLPAGTLAAPSVKTVNIGTAGGTGAQTYNGHVFLNNDTVLTSTSQSPATGGGAITFNGAVDNLSGNRSLTVTTGPGQTTFGTGTAAFVNQLDLSGANVAFNGTVGSSGSPLNVLTVSRTGTGAASSIALNNGGFTTSLGQIYRDPVTLGATTLLRDTGSSAITFSSTVQSAGTTTPRALTINTAGKTTFGGAVGGPLGPVLTGVTTAPALASLSVQGGGEIDINGGSITTVAGAGGTQQYGGPIVLGGPTTLQGYSATFGGAFTSAATAGAPFNLTLDFFGAETLPGGGTFAGVRDLLVEGPGGVSLNGAITTQGNQEFDNGVVTLTGNTALTAGTSIPGGSITFNSNVVDGTPGAHSLTLVTGNLGSVAINAPVGTAPNNTSAPLGSLTALSSTTTVGSVTTNAPEKVTIAATSVTTTGSQNYGTLTLGGTGLTTLASTAATGAAGINSGPVTGGGNPLTISVASTGGNSTIGTITNAGALNLTMGGTSAFGTINDAAPVNYSGGTVNFSGITATALTAAATGAANFNGPVNATDIVSNGTGTTAFNAAVTGTSLTVTGGTGVTLNLGGLAITTTGEQNYNEPALLGSAGTLTGQGTLANGGVAVRFGSTLGGDFALTLSNTASGVVNVGSDTVFAGAVGTLLSLNASGVGTTQINGGGVVTNGAAGQVYSGAVTLGATTVLTASNAGPVNFVSTLQSAGTPRALTINTSPTGVTTFNAQVGGAPGTPGTAIAAAPALASLTTTGGEVDVKAGVTTVTGPGGFQNYGGAVKLTGDATLEGYSLSLGSGLSGQTGAYSLTLDFTSQVALPGGIVGLNNFTTVGFGGVLLNGGTLSTVGTQTYRNGAVTLGASTILTSTTASLLFNTPIDGNASLTLNALGAGGQVIFGTGAQVGNATTVGTLTSNTANGTLFDMNATVKGGVNAAAVATTGPVTFDEAGASGAQPDVLTTGAQTYNTGAVTLNRNTFLTSTGTAATGAISFGASAATAATIDSALGTARSLTLNTLGTQTFYGLVGSATNTMNATTGALGGLTTGPGPTAFDMAIPSGAPAGVRVNGAVTVAGPATFNATYALPAQALTQPTVLTLGGGAQTYGTLTNPLGTAVTLLGAVTVLNSANTEPTPGTFNGGGTIIFNGNIVAGVAAPELDVRAGLGTVEFDSPLYTAGDFAPGGASVTFRGGLGTMANPLGVFTVLPNGGGTGTPLIDLNGGVVSTGGLQNYAFPTVLSANTVLTATGSGNITFGTLDGSNLPNNAPYTLAINVNGGLVAFNGIVGGTVPLQSLAIGNVGATLGTTRFAMNLTGLGANQGGVNVLGPVVVNTNTDFEATGGTGSTPTILSGVTYLGVPGTGTQTYGQTTTAAAVTVGQNTVLQDLASGAITFNGRVNAAADGGAFLSVNTGGDEVFNQLVGNTFTLASLTTDAQGTVGGAARFNMDLTQAGATAGVRLAGALNVNDRVAFNATPGAALPTVLSGGAQNYALAAAVRTNTVLTATSGNLAFAGTVDSGSTASALTLNTPDDEVFNGPVGASAPLASLTTDATGTVGGTTRFVLTLPATGLAAGVGGVNVAGAVTLDDRVLFQVANTTPAHPSIVSGGTQTYDGAATLGAATILTSTGAGLVFNSTLDSDGPATARDFTTNTPAVGSFATFAQTVGGTNALASLTTNGNGTTQINGGVTANARTITTTGAQEYLQAVTLGAGTLLSAGGNVDFGNVAGGNLASSLDGTHNLTVNASAASFEAVGNNAPLVNLTVNAGGTAFNYVPALVSAGNAGVNLAGALTLNSPAVFNGAGAGSIVFVRTGVTVPAVTAAGGQDFNGTVAFAGTGTFTDLQSGTIKFRQAVDALSPTGLAGLTVSTGGTVSFLGPVGATTPLTSLLTSNLGLPTGRTIIGGGSVTTINRGTAGATGAQTYNDAVFLSADTTLTGTTATGVTTGGDVTFALTLNSLSTPQALTVNTSGQTIFGGAVGAANALASLTTDAPGSTRVNGGSVTTTGLQNYSDIVTLGAATTLTSTAGGNIAFAKTLDSATAGTPETLAVNTGGATIFGGAVGAANALASLTTDALGSTRVNGGSVRTTGAQTYNDAVFLSAATVLASTANGALTFNGTLDGAFALTLNTGGATVFNQAVGNATALTSLLTDAPGSTQFNMPVGPVAGVAVNGPVTINDPVSFAATGASLTVPTVLTTGNGVQTYAGAVSLGTNTFLVSATGGALPFAGGGSVAFTSPLGIASTGGSDLYVRAGVGVTTVNAAVSANTVDLGGAAVAFAGPVTLPGTVSVEPNGGVGGGSILFNGGTITTAGTQVYNVPFVLGGNTVLASTGGGTITFNAALDGAFNLTLNSTGDEVFNGQIGGTAPLASLTTDDPAAVTPGGRVIFAFAGTTASPGVKTTGAQTFNDAALLRADTVLASTGGTITFNSTVDGARALTLNAAGDEVFNGRVGGNTALASLVTDDPAGTISGGRVVFNVANSTTALPGVTTTGAQTFNDAAFLSTNTVLASTGAGTLAFNSTLDGARALTLDTAGDEVFNGAVGGTTALTSLVTDDPAANTPGGHVVFNVPGAGRSVTTTGAQTYHDAVTLLAGTTLTSTGNGALTFVSTVDGAQALAVNTGGLTTFSAPVGSGTPLASVTTRGGGAVALNAGTVNTTGLQSYGGVVTLGADTTLASTAATGGGIAFLTTLDSDAAPRALTLNAAGDETFNGRVGGTSPLASLTTDATGAGGRVVFAVTGGSTTAAPAVTTLGAQTYHDAALLQTDTVLASRNGGALTFNSTVDGAQALTLNTAGDAVFNGAVGAVTALASLLTNDPAGAIAGGRVVFNVVGSTLAAPSVRTTGLQTFNDALVMLADTVLTSTQGGTLTFNSTVDGAQALSLSSSGDELFNARVGGSGAGLASLTTDADAANRGGRAIFAFAGGTDDAPSVKTTGAQTFNDNANLRADTVLTSTGGNLTFGAALDGAQALTLNAAGDEVFRGAVGGNRALTSLLTDDDANVRGGHVVFEFAGSSGTPSVRTTGLQTYRDAATLRAPTYLTSTGGAALTFRSTVDGAADLTLDTTGLTTLAAAVGSVTSLNNLTVAGGGAVALNAGSVTTTGTQLYTGAVALGGTTVLTSAGATFDSTLDGGESLTFVNPAGTTTFGGAVGGIAPLNTLTFADGSNVLITGGSVTTLNLQTYGGHVEVSRADGGFTTVSAVNNQLVGDGLQGNNLVFKQNVDADNGSLLVSGYRILAEPASNINVAGGGVLDLEASNTLILQGDNYGSGSGAVVLNDPANAAYPNTATRATIFLANEGRTLFHGGSFDMGYLQNMFSRGSIAIAVPGGVATLSDIAANGTLTVQASQIVLRARDPDGARGAVGGGTDDGLNFVARTSISFGNSPIRYDNSHSSNDVANFVTTAGQVTINRDSARGLSIFQDPTLASTFAQAGGGGLTDLNFGTFEFPFQPISGGTQTIDTAAALSGALPDQKPLDVAVDITISASQLEELLKLGIHPRKAQKQERLSLASKRALFAQLVDGLDKDNYGRLQPIKGGISTLVPSDYVVVVDRMSEHEVQAILTAFEELYGKNKEKAPPIGEAFNTAFTDYSTEKQTADPAGFAPYIAAQPNKYPDINKAVKGFDNLFGYIEHLGLTEKEQAKAKEHIASDLQVSGVTADDMVKAIDTLRARIPKDQQAPSTRLPPSAPAGNPAPGATSPGQPEQKKGTPPLKTARRSSAPDAAHPTARHSRPLAEDRAREVAGL